MELTLRSIVVIDDDEAVLSFLKEELAKAFPGSQCHTESDFANAATALRDAKPDAVILDLRRGAIDADLPGERTWRSLWNDQFFPVVIYTAVDDPIEPSVPAGHPFIQRVKKGTGSEKEVIRCLQGFAPHLDAINQLHDELERVVGRVLRDTAGEGVLSGDDPTQLRHAARRRVAAMMDDAALTDGRSLFAWEQYLVPAIGDSPLTGDLLLRTDAERDKPTNYRLIVTPSCDLVKGRNQSVVLVAKCDPCDRLIRLMSLPQKQPDAVQRLRERVLSQGFWNGFVPLPGFGRLIPAMVACLKEIEVLSYDAIIPPDGATASYHRVASIDSPFREQISWALLSTIARPGMPDRDLAAWASEILTAAAEATTQPPG